MSDMDPERDLTMDAYRLAQAIKFAAVVIGLSMILLGLMVWQPWASVREQELTRGNGGYKVTCLVYKETFRCP